MKEKTKHTEERNCSNCTNGSCRVESSEKIGLDEFKNPQGTGCIGWSNPELVNKRKVLKKSN